MTLEQLNAQNLIDGFAAVSYVLIAGFTVVAITNMLAIGYLIKIHKALKKLKTA
jgi:hypothetical protein